MTITTMHRDLLAAFIDVIHNRLVQIKLVTLLIKIGNLQFGTATDLTTIGQQVSQQHLDQGGLAGAIRADNTDAVTTHDGR